MGRVNLSDLRKRLGLSVDTDKIESPHSKVKSLKEFLRSPPKEVTHKIHGFVTKARLEGATSDFIKYSVSLFKQEDGEFYGSEIVTIFKKSCVESKKYVEAYNLGFEERFVSSYHSFTDSFVRRAGIDWTIRWLEEIYGFELYSQL